MGSKEEEKKTLLQDQATVDVANAEAENIRATAKHNLRVAKTLGEMQEKQGLILSGVEAIKAEVVKAEGKVAAVEAEEKSIEEKLPTRAPTMDKEEAEVKASNEEDVKEAEEERKVEEEEKEEKDKEEEKEESKEEEKKTLLQDQATVDVANAE